MYEALIYTSYSRHLFSKTLIGKVMSVKQMLIKKYRNIDILEINTTENFKLRSKHQLVNTSQKIIKILVVGYLI